MERQIEYKCPNCGAALRYDPAQGEVVCGNCGSRFSTEALDALLHADESTDQAFDWGDYLHGLNEDTLTGTVVYHCDSCGAVLEADEHTLARTCPYCGNNVVISEHASGGLRPNAVLPFLFDEKEAMEKVKEYYKKKKLLPNDFFNLNRSGRIQGVYVPFWLFSCKMSGSITMDGTTMTTYREGDYDVTRTNHFLLEREGEMAFENIPVDASTKMDNDLMDSIEPFDFSGLREYNGGYLAGYVADRFDSDPDAEQGRASERAKNTAVQAFTDTCAGYMTRLRSSNLSLQAPSVKYVLLPVYLLVCRYKDREYRYAINGQTGKVVGELPISAGKSILFFLRGLLITLAIAFLVSLIMK